MKKIRISFLRTINVALASILTILGFNNCSEPLVEYGTPNADYTLKGTVINKADTKPIKGIRVGFSMVYPDPMLMYGVIPQPFNSTKADTTDLKGAFKLTDNFTISEVGQKIATVYIQDIDGVDNGAFNDTTIQVDYNKVKKTGKSSDWYEGEYNVDLTIQLTKKTDKNE